MADTDLPNGYGTIKPAPSPASPDRIAVRDFPGPRGNNKSQPGTGLQRAAPRGRAAEGYAGKSRTDKEKAPREGGAEVNGETNEKGQTGLRPGPGECCAGSPVDRNGTAR